MLLVVVELRHRFQLVLGRVQHGMIPIIAISGFPESGLILSWSLYLSLLWTLQAHCST